ncbi:MAG: trypsin-like peptidase domain-containing protein [Lachnospiraceae bacterium]|nr:trypsin-like peptidase domain-containing protein [Lachnospiraceae bacterium]
MEENKNQNNTDFMKETIKQRPLNRKKLVRRTLVTAAMAVIFGMVACFTFLLLEPIISNRLYPEEEPQTVVLVENVEENEILPEDMIADESQMQTGNEEVPALEDEQIAQVLSEIKLGSEEYISLYSSLNELAKEAYRSVVTVVGVTSDVGWLDNEYESKGAVSGVIVADNGRDLLILANASSIKDADSLKVTFIDGQEYQASIKKRDSHTGLAVISISKSIIKSSTLGAVKAATLGTSGNSLVGSPIIALGRPMGTEGSICYGNITSMGNITGLSDSDYKYITTNIYGSMNASGILINLRGQVVGIIDMSQSPDDMKNLISGIGISELKKVVERLSNNNDIAYFGVCGTDVTEEANRKMGVPFGAYITEIDMDSPAMDAGIQSGDVIIRLDGMEIASYQQMVKELLLKEPEKEIKIGIMREGPDGYTEMELSAVLGLKK